MISPMRELEASVTHIKLEDVPKELLADTLIRIFDVGMMTETDI